MSETGWQPSLLYPDPAVITLDPGLVFSATVALMHDPAAGMPPGHVSVDVPAAAIAYLATLDDAIVALTTGEAA